MIEHGNASGGEDEGSTEHEGDDSHLREDQKSAAVHDKDKRDGDTKTQDLARAGRDDFDPNSGQE